MFCEQFRPFCDTNDDFVDDIGALLEFFCHYHLGRGSYVMSRAHGRISGCDDWHPVCSVGRVQLTFMSVMTDKSWLKDLLWDSKPSLEGVPPQFASAKQAVAMSIDA